MKLSFLAGLLVCGCLASFRAQAVSFEYDWTDSSNPSYTGQIFLNASSGSQTLSLLSPIVSYNITANGTTFTSGPLGNSVLTGNFLSTIVWDASTISTMTLQISLLPIDNPNNISTLSVQDSTINGAVAPGVRGTTVDGEWDAPPTSIPDPFNTLPLFAIALGALGWYYYGLRQPQLAPAAIKR